MNFFNTTMSLLDRLKRDELSDVLKYIKEGALLVNERLLKKTLEVRSKKDYLVV